MSDSASPGSQPTPDRLMQALFASQMTAVIKTAIELDVFTTIAEGSDSAASVAQARGASERGTRILCDALAVYGFLEKENNRYRLAPDTAVFLDRRSPAYLGSIAGFLTNPDLTRGLQELTAAVRKGGTALSAEGSIAAENPMWVQFARDMMPLMMPAAQAIAGMVGAAAEAPLKVLDIAAGHGIFGIMAAQRYPRAQVVAVDWAPVLEVARENAQKMGVGDRHTLLPGSAFDVDFGSDYDVALVTNFLHHFDAETCTGLLKKIHASLKPGGQVFTLEFVPNEDRISPPFAALFSVTMLISTPNGIAYTFPEFRKMFADAGYSRCDLHPLPPSPYSVVVAGR